MPPAETPQKPEPDDGAGAQPRHDPISAKPSRASPLMRIQILTGGYVARHPRLLRVMEGLGWNNPGGGMNP